ncbi:hypothetical protein KIPB_007637 [Kipferlia bialata]|uniref:Uncharacterized protein n=1 Tax=Kipferlia bialata TaxID=797122 RepID=A0A9K3CZH7_9EUKA|nr:hypothetical protein KIPB_007637 [Kipferlia bialata]|eukprot:g7637.t1
MLSLDDFVNASIPLLVLERVTTGDINLWEFTPLAVGPTSVLNVDDWCLYTVGHEDGVPTLRKGQGINPPPDLDERGVTVGSCIYFLGSTPSSWDVYHRDTGEWSQCAPDDGPTEDEFIQSIIPQDGKILVATEYVSDETSVQHTCRMWLFDTDRDTWQRVADPPIDPDTEEQVLPNHPVAVGDSVLYTNVYGVKETPEPVHSFSLTRGWEVEEGCNAPSSVWGGIYITLQNSTLFVGYSKEELPEGVFAIGYFDAASGEFTQCCHTDFECRGVQLSHDRCLLGIVRDDQDTDELYLVHIDHGRLQESGGIPTAEQFGVVESHH